jgi:thiol-disulfide isomerase/thioredoxin
MRSLLLYSALCALGASTFAASTGFAASPVPRPAGELEVVDSAGKHLLSSYKGKVVVVQFLLTTCSHCQAYSQLLNALQAEYGPRGFQALGAAVNEATPAMAKDYATQFAPRFPVGAMLRDPMLAFMGQSVLDRLGFPQIAVVDRKGQIREQTSTGLDQHQPLQDETHLRALIEKLLAEGTSMSTAKAR